MSLLYWIRFSRGGNLEGVIITDASSLGLAAERAGRDLPRHWSYQVKPIRRADARVIPKRFIGRMLTERETIELELIIIEGRKTPPEPSRR
jgi:hypothetical protein